jgi:hypothetical protein
VRSNSVLSLEREKPRQRLDYDKKKPGLVLVVGNEK